MPNNVRFRQFRINVRITNEGWRGLKVKGVVSPVLYPFGDVACKAENNTGVKFGFTPRGTELKELLEKDLGLSAKIMSINMEVKRLRCCLTDPLWDYKTNI